MDFLSVFQWLFGISLGQKNRSDDKKNEVARLSAEIHADVARTLDLLAHETPRLLIRCERVCPGDQEVRAACASTMEKIRSDAAQLLDLVQSNRKLLDGKAMPDWNAVVRFYYEWRGTASRLVPWVVSTIKRFDDLLDNEAAQRRLK